MTPAFSHQSVARSLGASCFRDRPTRGGRGLFRAGFGATIVVTGRRAVAVAGVAAAIGGATIGRATVASGSTRIAGRLTGGPTTCRASAGITSPAAVRLGKRA